MKSQSTFLILGIIAFGKFRRQLVYITSTTTTSPCWRSRWWWWCCCCCYLLLSFLLGRRLCCSSILLDHDISTRVETLALAFWYFNCPFSSLTKECLFCTLYKPKVRCKAYSHGICWWWCVHVMGKMFVVDCGYRIWFFRATALFGAKNEGAFLMRALQIASS